MLLFNDSTIEDLFYCAPAWSKTCLCVGVLGVHSFSNVNKHFKNRCPLHCQLTALTSTTAKNLALDHVKNAGHASLLLRTIVIHPASLQQQKLKQTSAEDTGKCFLFLSYFRSWGWRDGCGGWGGSSARKWEHYAFFFFFVFEICGHEYTRSIAQADTGIDITISRTVIRQCHRKAQLILAKHTKYQKSYSRIT